MHIAKLIVTAAAAALLHSASGAGAQNAPLPPPAAASTFDNFDTFRRPNVVRALYADDGAFLKRDRANNFLYLQIIIEAFSAPDAWYRMGQEAEARLDPLLAPTVRGLAVTERENLEAIIKPGIGTLSQMVMEWSRERQQQLNNGTFDPLGEATALNRGMLRGANGLARMKADAGFDAKLLMITARDNPEAFTRIYNGMRSFIYSY